MFAAALIAIDWGTTSARAYRIDNAGRISGERSAPLGIQNVRDGGFAAALAMILGDWSDDPAPRIACGMIGSKQGWIETPYCTCPIQSDALSRSLVRVPDGSLTIVPGVCCRDAARIPDVMRGEETQIIGLTAALDALASSRFIAVLPGTHSKWAVVDGSAIETFATFMTGELYAVLRQHSILGRLMTSPTAESREMDRDAFSRGVMRAIDADGNASLLHELFGARTLALCGEMASTAIADYLSGLLIAHEIAAGRRWARDNAAHDARLVLAGESSLMARYVAAFEAFGMSVVVGPSNAAALGLWRIAKQAGFCA